MPQYFHKQSKYASFARKLNRWGFVRVSRGPESGAYYHPHFRRGEKRLCKDMRCLPLTSSKPEVPEHAVPQYRNPQMFMQPPMPHAPHYDYSQYGQPHQMTMTAAAAEHQHQQMPFASVPPDQQQIYFQSPPPHPGYPPMHQPQMPHPGYGPSYDRIHPDSNQSSQYPYAHPLEMGQQQQYGGYPPHPHHYHQPTDESHPDDPYVIETKGEEDRSSSPHSWSKPH